MEIPPDKGGISFVANMRYDMTMKTSIFSPVRLIIGGIGIIVLLLVLMIVQMATEQETAALAPRVFDITEEERQDAESKRAQFSAVLEEDPEDSDASIELARAEHLLGNDEAAIAVMNEALTYRPQSMSLNVQLATIYRDMGRAEDAVEVYEELVKNDLPLSIVYVQYINLLREIDRTSMERIEGVYAYAKDRVTIDPENILSVMAQIYTERGMEEEAIGMWELWLEHGTAGREQVESEIEELRERANK
jgi:tetratricopeptide (TPR) repeat protein